MDHGQASHGPLGRSPFSRMKPKRGALRWGGHATTAGVVHRILRLTLRSVEGALLSGDLLRHRAPRGVPHRAEPRARAVALDGPRLGADPGAQAAHEPRALEVGERP